jgi:protein-tyrosine phosphatase
VTFVFGAATTPREGPFRILFVCTGNICRSPQAEAIVAARLDGMARGLDQLEPGRGDLIRSQLAVGSAGTSALVDRPSPDEVVRTTASRGGDVRRHRARQATREILDDADLVLVMEREQRRWVAHEAPRTSRIVFTLPEFARLMAHAARSDDVDLPSWPGESLASWMRDALAEIGAQRGLVPPVAAADDEIVDPYRRELDVYERSADAVAAAVTTVFDAVRTIATRSR